MKRSSLTIVLTGLLVLAFVGTGHTFSKDSAFVGWKTALTWDLTTAQTAYSDSWTGGEAGSLNWQTNLNGKAAKHMSPKFFLRSQLKLAFGQTLTQDEETRDWSKPKKSTDLIDWETVGEFNLHKFVDPYIAFRLESQFFDGRVPEKKLYFSPIKLTESAGIIKNLYSKDDDVVASRVGVAARQILKRVITGADTTAGIITYSTEDSTLTDLGVEWVTDAVLTLSDKMLYTGKLTVYKAFAFSESDNVKGTPFEDDWKAVDVALENIVAAQVSKIVGVFFYTQFLYDKEISKKVRIKETVAIGVTFKLL
jgi:hypothetical protein